MKMVLRSEMKQVIAPLRAALYDFVPDVVRRVIGDVVAPDAVVHMSHPFGDMDGAGWYDTSFAPLGAALPDVERRDMIVTAGRTPEGADWLGCCGVYTGTFAGPLLDIPPSGQQVVLRYHEFFRIEDGRVTEVQAIWDLPSLMMQAGAWPMAPSLGRDLLLAPASGDGLALCEDEARAQVAIDVVIGMLTRLSMHPSQGGPEIMQAERFWHPKMCWYGPGGIGTARGFAGFRAWHQIPFLNAMPDRRGGTTGTQLSHFFAEGDYVAVTGWPNMEMTVSGDGWMGIAPAGQAITMKSLDFWRVEGKLIRENWVLVDILDVYRQLGVDVMARLREFNKARVPGRVPFPIGDPR
jgi:predicted ester cyclase